MTNNDVNAAYGRCLYEALLNTPFDDINNDEDRAVWLRYCQYIDMRAQAAAREYCQYVDMRAQAAEFEELNPEYKDYNQRRLVAAQTCQNCMDYRPEWDVSGDYLDVDDVVEYQAYLNAPPEYHSAEADAYYADLFDQARIAHHRDYCRVYM